MLFFSSYREFRHIVSSAEKSYGVANRLIFVRAANSRDALSEILFQGEGHQDREFYVDCKSTGCKVSLVWCRVLFE